jgi:hypothetical protein
VQFADAVLSVCLFARHPAVQFADAVLSVCLVAGALAVVVRACVLLVPGTKQRKQHNTANRPGFVCQKMFPKHTGMLYSMDHIRGEASAAASQPASHSPAQNTNHKTVPAGEKTHQRTSGSGDAACPGPGC